MSGVRKGLKILHNPHHSGNKSKVESVSSVFMRLKQNNSFRLRWFYLGQEELALRPQIFHRSFTVAEKEVIREGGSILGVSKRLGALQKVIIKGLRSGPQLLCRL